MDITELEQFSLSSLSVFFSLQSLLLPQKIDWSAKEDEQIKVERKGKQERKVVRIDRNQVYVCICVGEESYDDSNDELESETKPGGSLYILVQHPYSTDEKTEYKKDLKDLHKVMQQVGAELDDRTQVFSTACF